MIKLEDLYNTIIEVIIILITTLGAPIKDGYLNNSKLVNVTKEKLKN